MREQDALRALASAQRALQAVRERKAALMAELEQALIRRENLGKEPVSGVAFQLEGNFISGTKQRIVQTEHAIQKAVRGVEKALRAYLGARKQTRTMEVMREKAFEEFKRQLKKHEQKELNDLYVMRARVDAEVVG